MTPSILDKIIIEQKKPSANVTSEGSLKKKMSQKVGKSPKAAGGQLPKIIKSTIHKLDFLR